MVYSEMSLLFRCKKMKTMRFCNKTESVNPLKNRDLGVKSKKWFVKNVAPPEIDIGLTQPVRVNYHGNTNLVKHCDRV